MSFETTYFFSDEIKDNLRNLTMQENLCLLHLNIRSINANFENFRNLLEESSFIFNLICLSETWSTNENFNNNSTFQLQNYDAIHFQRKLAKRGGGLLIYVKNNITYKVREDLNISNS